MPTHIRSIISTPRHAIAVPVHVHHVGRGWYAHTSENGENGSALVVYVEAGLDDAVRMFVILGNMLFYTWRVTVGAQRVVDAETGFIRCVAGDRETAIQAVLKIAEVIISRNRLTEAPAQVSAIRASQLVMEVSA